VPSPRLIVVLRATPEGNHGRPHEFVKSLDNIGPVLNILLTNRQP
jgi:hypothetical protein